MKLHYLLFTPAELQLLQEMCKQKDMEILAEPWASVLRTLIEKVRVAASQKG